MGRDTGKEAGIATTAIIIMASVLLLALGFWYTQRVAKMEDQAGALQTAADAAALAGAQMIVADSPTLLRRLVNGYGLPAGGEGQSAASTFAARNGASLVHYHYAASTGRLEVRVRSSARLESGRREEASATARVGLRLGACSLPDKPKPKPTPAPTPHPDEPPAPPVPPPDYSGNASCGEFTVPVKVDGEDQQVTVQMSDAQIKSHFAPALAR
ncbi:MAG: hypothetical protein QM708_04595 [Propioniciclava sp.]|uniref:pilus assembly protein TadG-related protein n=1 Tax=Propioniciclava sp. TaxID=2038686 RepID=UPI0039E3B3DB